MLHLMTIRTIDVKDEWVSERTDQLTENAFDFGHMLTIRKKISKDTYGDAYGSDEQADPYKKD